MKQTASYPKRKILVKELINMAKRLGCYDLVSDYCKEPTFANYGKALLSLDASLFEFILPPISTEGWRVKKQGVDATESIYVFETESFVSQISNSRFLEKINLMSVLTLAAYRNVIPRKFLIINMENQLDLFQDFYIDMRKFFLRRYYKQSRQIPIHLSVSKAFRFFLCQKYHQLSNKADLSLNVKSPGTDNELQDFLPHESKEFYESPEVTFEVISDLLSDPKFKDNHIQFIGLHYGLIINEDRKVVDRSEFEPMALKTIGPVLGLTVDQVEYLATQVLNLFFLNRNKDKLDPAVLKTLFKKSGEVRQPQLTKLRVSIEPNRKSRNKKTISA
jgi:hypothetical protein